MSVEKSHDELFTSRKAVQVRMLLKHNVYVNIFDSNCIEMGAEAIEMD